VPFAGNLPAGDCAAVSGELVLVTETEAFDQELGVRWKEQENG